MKRTLSIALVALALALLAVSANVPVSLAAPAICLGNIASGVSAFSDTVTGASAPTNAVDGNIDESSVWQSSNTVNANGEHFWIDLGQPTNFTGIRIYWWQAASRFMLETSDDGANWTALVNSPTVNANNITIWAGSKTARYVRMTASHTNTLDGTIGVYEFMVMSPTACLTTVKVGANPNPSIYGQPINLIARVAASDGSTPLGKIDFDLDGTPITGCTSKSLSLGKANCVLTTPLNVGTYTINASYTPAGAWTTGAGSIVQTVNPANTRTGITSYSPSVAGQTVTFKATVGAVTPGTGIPDGTVDFTANGNALCTGVALSNGQATCTPAPGLLAGSWNIQAFYSGSTNYNASTGARLQTVYRASTATTVQISPNRLNPGDDVTMTATVAVVPPGTAVNLGGTVSFLDNGVAIPNCTSLAIDPGTRQAVCGPVGFSVSGLHAVTAFYSGDANYKPSKNAIAARFVVRWMPKLTTRILNSKNVVIASAPPGTVVHARAGVAGSQGIPTGSVTFTLYYGTDCTNMVASQTVSLVNGLANSGVVTQMSSGVSFQVSYNGNVIYAPATGACQPLNVP